MKSLPEPEFVRCTWTEFTEQSERRCVKEVHGKDVKHLMGTIWTLDDTVGLPAPTSSTNNG